MNKDKNKWIEDVLHSMEGHQYKQPPTNLFSKIKYQIETSEAKQLSINVWRYVAAAAVVLLINVGSVLYYAQLSSRQNSTTNAYYQSPVTQFNFYE